MCQTCKLITLLVYHSSISSITRPYHYSHWQILFQHPKLPQNTTFYSILTILKLTHTALTPFSQLSLRIYHRKKVKNVKSLNNHNFVTVGPTELADTSLESSLHALSDAVNISWLKRTIKPQSGFIPQSFYGKALPSLSLPDSFSASKITPKYQISWNSDDT